MSEQKITITIKGENMGGNANGKFSTVATITEATLNKIMSLLIEGNGANNAKNPSSPVALKIGSMMK